MLTLTYEQWLAEGTRLFGPDTRDWQFICPSCGTVQTARDFYALGFIPHTGEVGRLIGFECIGRHNGWPGKIPDSGKIKGCLFGFGTHGRQLCALEITRAGHAPSPRFAFAPPRASEAAITPPGTPPSQSSFNL